MEDAGANVEEAGIASAEEQRFLGEAMLGYMAIGSRQYRLFRGSEWRLGCWMVLGMKLSTASWR